MNELIKNYKIVLYVVVPILILVLIRSFDTVHFKSDAKKWAEPSVLQSNIITQEKAGSLAGNKLIIDLDKVKSGINGSAGTEIEILPDAILLSENLKRIKKNDGPVLLFSSDPSLSSRIWMVLSQMGLKNIFILTNDPGNEEQKFKFIHDSILKPTF